jgi:pimeloyl-ACP methyl ester carboxylesterase
MYAEVNGVSLYYEQTGEGFPIIFSHEFAGDYRSWEPQVRFFSRSYRCITFNHRGYPPSAVPQEPGAYSQDNMIEDLAGLARNLGIQQAHWVGCSMGAQGVLMLSMHYPELCRSTTVVGCGSGSVNHDDFVANSEAHARGLKDGGVDYLQQYVSAQPSRIAYKLKDPRGWAEFRNQLAEHSALGSALTQLGIQRMRPTVMQLGEELQRLRVPTLLMIGDQDEPCVDANVFMRRQCPTAGLVVVPRSGHTVNLEEPDLFNDIVLRFFNSVETNRWLAGEAPVSAYARVAAHTV